jgi:hypothetical protein
MKLKSVHRQIYIQNTAKINIPWYISDYFYEKMRTRILVRAVKLTHYDA